VPAHTFVHHVAKGSVLEPDLVNENGVLDRPTLPKAGSQYKFIDQVISSPFLKEPVEADPHQPKEVS